ncbi:molybdenum cofactor biosynthesis protein B [Halorientalis sp. IM1011]|uniref:MogA/MoaB family molybdenum cofactor biosynthesis protein n=1 Tax=Halorientalis sp. IM1011 TaxID=1932360 RepID=UPI00097CCB66|nr:molybdenum cofactor biosynthesis protein B [Halorientalis sp. IM1011]AQL43510.1 molybdenum cofactor biosynthesis protein B [Halorientalis sp. IM1011]
MVDFQSRDTRRSVDDGDDDPSTADATGADEPEGHDEGHDDSGDDGGHAHDHDHHEHDRESLGVAIVTISSSRTREDDPAGDAIESALTDAGHEIAVRDVIRDDHDGVQNTVDAVAGRGDVDTVVTTGGTGITPDDVTVEAVRPLFDKELPGFGELFRRRSYDDIGTKVVGTRATAGVVDGVVVFCLPGSENAARLGAEEIIVEQAPHLVGLAQRE